MRWTGGIGWVGLGCMFGIGWVDPGWVLGIVNFSVGVSCVLSAMISFPLRSELFRLRRIGLLHQKTQKPGCQE